MFQEPVAWYSGYSAMSQLRTILEFIESGKPGSTQELAQLTGTDRTTLQLMLNDLERMGYLLRPGEFACEPAGCGGCGRSCQKSPGAGAWILTEKGKKLVTGPTP